MPLTRRLILQKARHHPKKEALTDCKRTVSGTISLPSRGTFHHSLTVLIRYRSQQVFRLTGWSRQSHSRFHEPAATRGHSQPKKLMFSRTGLSPSTAGHSKPLPLTPTTRRQADRPTTQDPTTPHMQPLSGITHMKFSQKSDFARRYSRNHNCFLLLRVLRCFTSPRSLHTSYFIHQRVTAHNHGRVSPFGHPRINAQLATPRGITQPLTSFIGSLCQGIHRAPFTDNTKTFIKMTRDHKHDQKLHTIKKILASTIQFSNNTTANHTNTQTTQQAARHQCDRPVSGACCSRHPTDATNQPQLCRTPQDRVNLKKTVIQG